MKEYLDVVPSWMIVIVLFVGFFFLIKGADLFVDGSSSIAKRYKVPQLIIGLTIVAMGTSLPETAVSVTASLAGNNEIAISNAVGSNIFNLMVVIGFCSLLTPVKVDRKTLKRDFPFSIVCAGLLLMLGCFEMKLGHIDGVLLLVLFAFYIFVLIKVARKHQKETTTEVEDEVEELPLVKSIIFLIIGGVGIALGGDLVVDSASRIAVSMGMSQTLVGLTVISVGTSLPELVTSLVAARKNEIDMALGNVIGSNIFNFLMVLGIASALSPVAFIRENIIDIIVLIIFSVFVWIAAWRKGAIKKGAGIIMLTAYVCYAVYIVLR